MFTRTFHPRHFLSYVYGTEPFAEYCQLRGIAFEQLVGMAMRDDDFFRWYDVVRALPESATSQMELDLARVNELAHPRAIELLIAASRGKTLPPDDVPSDHARALWFYLNQPDLFHETFLRLQADEFHSWRSFEVPSSVDPLLVIDRRNALAGSLKKFFRSHEGTGRFCAVDALEVDGAVHFTAYVSNRLALLDAFSEHGERMTHISRPAFTVTFVYEPNDRRVLIRSRHRSSVRVVELFKLFSHVVLRVEVAVKSVSPVFQLNRLKEAFQPALDEADMECARVKALHLAYPERFGRRRIKLETNSGDTASAMSDLLCLHGGNGLLRELDVLYAELEVRLRIEGQIKRYTIRLWPDRVNLNRTQLGRRFRSCLKRWGLTHAP